MTIVLRIILLVTAIWMTAYMLKRIRQSKLQIEYSVFWILLDVAILILAIFPQILSAFAGVLGIFSPTNLLFAFLLFILLIKIFMMTLEISSLETSIRKLAQVIALKEEQEKEEKIHEQEQSSVK